MTPLQKISAGLLLSLTALLGVAPVRAQRFSRRETNPPATSSVDHRQQARLDGPATPLPRPLPPVLLLAPGHYGTLAAVRCLGRSSIPVTTGGPSPWTVSSFSKYSNRSVSCPPTSEAEPLLEWLEQFGREHERHVLLPTCDDTAWLYARHRERLAEYFYLSSPSIATIHALLHKGRLAEHARAVGLDTPHAWFPESDEELAAVARETRYPVLLKPTTQALFSTRNKGLVVESREKLASAYRELSALAHGAPILEYDPSVARPMVQEFFLDASESIYNVSGYVHDGVLSGARASRKLLQRPRLLGVGVCFEEAVLDERLTLGIAQLAQRVGFSGVFEAEFVRSGDRSVLIDFNPRFYNQMGFDVARGLALPLLAYYQALRGHAASDHEQEGTAGQQPTGKVFVNASAFKVMIKSQRAFGALSIKEAHEWLAWFDSTEGRHVDAVEDPDDVWPARLDRFQLARHYLRHPRHFLRSIALNR